MSAALVSFYVSRWTGLMSNEGLTAYLKGVRDDVVSAIGDADRMLAQRQAFVLVLQIYISDPDQQRALLDLMESDAGWRLTAESADTEVLRSLREHRRQLLEESQQAAAALAGCGDLVAQVEEMRVRKERLVASIGRNRQRIVTAEQDQQRMKEILPQDPTSLTRGE